MVMPFGKAPETGISFGMLTENCGARASRTGVAVSRLYLKFCQYYVRRTLRCTYGVGVALTATTVRQRRRLSFDENIVVECVG